MVKIVLNIGEQEITVSFDEAQKLYRELSGIFGTFKDNPLQDYYPPGTRNHGPFFNDPIKFTD